MKSILLWAVLKSDGVGRSAEGDEYEVEVTLQVPVVMRM